MQNLVPSTKCVHSLPKLCLLYKNSVKSCLKEIMQTLKDFPKFVHGLLKLVSHFKSTPKPMWVISSFEQYPLKNSLQDSQREDTNEVGRRIDSL